MGQAVLPLRNHPLVIVVRDDCLLVRIIVDGLIPSRLHAIRVVVHHVGLGQLKLMLDQVLSMMMTANNFQLGVNLSHVHTRIVLTVRLPFRQLARVIEARDNVTLLRFFVFVGMAVVGLIVVDLHHGGLGRLGHLIRRGNVA